MRMLNHIGRILASLGFVTALFLSTNGKADHDKVTDPAPLSTQARLSAYRNLDRSGITVSGLSSGGFFAHQFHIAYSSS